MSLPTATAEPLPPFPPGDPRWRELDFLRMGLPGDRVWRRRDKFGARARKVGTYDSPLAFAYVYLGKGLKPVRPLLPDGAPDPAFEPAVSFSDFHLALCEEAKHWMDGSARRMGVIAPRGAGKSWWTFEALPLWALAHGHRNFFMGYAHSNDQAKNLLNNIRRHLVGNDLLLFDFPDLAVPKGGRNNAQLVETTGGQAFATSGIDKVTLGARHEYDRPDLITIDDGEPNSGNYAKAGSKGSKEDRLDTIRDVVLRMTPEAVVLLSGTVVMPDSIGHNLVQHALGESTEDWIAQERFSAMYFNAILDEGTEQERSLWPRKWSLEWLKAERERNPKYALHFANQPMTSGGQYWQREDFRYDPHFPLDHFHMYVDPADSTKEGADYTAVVVVGTDIGRNRAVVLFAIQGRFNDVELGRRIAEYKANHPEMALLNVHVEGFMGGHSKLRTLQPLMPTGARGKLARIERAFAHYQSNKVWHARPFTTLEALLTAFPKVRNDDLPDALSGALRKAFGE
jgi:phage terminase large subunit-like protein